ncbi:MAG: 2-hydroxyacid dehydrogenase [Pseudomonadota bacterium]
MTKPEILLIGDYPDWDMEGLTANYTCHQTPHEDLDAETAARIRCVAFKGHSLFTAEMMADMPNLGLIANFGVGYDVIDVAAASSRGIKVTNTPGVLTDDVADLAVGMLIAATRRLLPADAWVRSGDWAAKGNYPLLRTVTGKRAGIMGLGRIGRAIAERLVAFKMDIHYHSRAPKDTPSDWTYHADPVAMAGAVDYVIVALSGGPETAGIVSKEVIAAVGPEGMLVNVSRGSTVDEEALITALQSGALGFAALDVFAVEPECDPRFGTLENTLLQPHQASATIETRQAMGKLQLSNIQAFYAGTPLITPVN